METLTIDACASDRLITPDMAHHLPGAELVTRDPDGIAGVAGVDEPICAVIDAGASVDARGDGTTHGAPFLIRVHGDVDVYTSPFLQGRTDRLVREMGVRELGIDLTFCGFIDSSGMVWLLNVRREMKSVGGTVYLSGLSGQPAKTLTMTKIADLFEVREDRAEDA